MTLSRFSGCGCKLTHFFLFYTVRETWLKRKKRPSLNTQCWRFAFALLIFTGSYSNRCLFLYIGSTWLNQSRRRRVMNWLAHRYALEDPASRWEQGRI